jgi:hypothetical protein
MLEPLPFAAMRPGCYDRDARLTRPGRKPDRTVDVLPDVPKVLRSGVLEAKDKEVALASVRA